MVKIVYCSSKRPEQFWPPRLGYLHQPIISISGDLIPSSAVSSHTRDIPHTYTQLKILEKKENYLINFGTLIIEQSLFLITLCLVFVGLRIWNCKELQPHAAFRVLIFNMNFFAIFPSQTLRYFMRRLSALSPRIKGYRMSKSFCCCPAVQD